MYWHFRFKVPKKLRQVTLWIHPEGRVAGSLFLSLQTKSGAGVEDPLEVVNEQAPFVVLQREAPEELRFYNKSSIVSIEYQEEQAPPAAGVQPLHCRLSMMDGSLIEGTVRRALPPSRSRLYDYINMANERFMKLYMEDGNVCLVNKAYIVYAMHLDEASAMSTNWLSSDMETR